MSSMEHLNLVNAEAIYLTLCFFFIDHTSVGHSPLCHVLFILLITWSHLSIVQASSSFRCLNMCTITYITPTFIAEVLHCFTYVLYLSILKLGLYTCRGSNIYWVVQQNEWNKYMGPFKHWVPKLLNIIDVKMVPYVEENKLIFNISLDMFILLSDITTVVCLQHICNVYCLPAWCSYSVLSVSEDHTHL